MAQAELSGKNPPIAKYPCASCSQLFDVSELVRFEGEIYCLKCLQEWSDEQKRKTKMWVIWSSLVAVAAIAVLVLWLFVFRDTWENDHRNQMQSLLEDARTSRNADDLVSASKKYHELLDLIGKRIIKDYSLRSELDAARGESVGVEDELVLRQLPKMLQQASDLLAADKLEESRSRYQSVINSVHSQSNHSPDMQDALNRAMDGLNKVDARRAAIDADRARQEQERIAAEQQRIADAAQAKLQQDRDAANAKIRGIISGGTWVVKGGGSSDLLRGMKVYLLGPECKGTTLSKGYDILAANAQAGAVFWRKAAVEYRAKPDEFGIWKKGADEFDGWVKDIDAYVASIAASKAKIPTRLGLTEAYNSLASLRHRKPPNCDHIPISDGFAPVVIECTVKVTQANIDGKYSFDAVPGGNYFIYAYWKTSFNEIEWLVPVTVKESGTVGKDLFNDTASDIYETSK